MPAESPPRTVLAQRFGVTSIYRLVQKIMRSLYYLAFAERTYKFAVRPLLEFNSLDALRAFCTGYPIYENCQPIRLDPARSFGRRLLFIAAHPDDETIGAGGTMLRALKSGQKIHVLYVTDGGQGGAGSYEVNRALRRQEALDQAEALGVTHEFLGAPDGLFQVTDELSHLLAEKIRAFSPDSIFLPWLLEANVAHRQANRLLLAALEREPSEAAIFAYQVWSNLPANTFVDITEVMDEKLAAVRRWKSQVELFDYVHFTRGMNAHGSYLQSGRGYVEPFFNLPAKDYVALLRRYYG